MDAIFGKTSKAELFSPKNGLIISGTIKRVFDTGFLVIVPQLPERPTKLQIAKWLAQKPRQYMTRIIDPSSKLMEHRLCLSTAVRFKDLDNRPLNFRNDFRPAARYLYFHYCLQILRRAWKQPVEQSKAALKNEIGKRYWGTPGRYLPRNMLLAFVEELGHEYDELLEGASCNKGEDMALLAAMSRHVKKRTPLNCGEESEGEGESEDDEDEEDGD
ncbi:hypothetical protein FQN54_006729 [Arachnomyces sp. PD_36]|nr:hypothetical protein FQN54_006729 [Arachnomyces sp. PD_36]